MTAPAIFGYEPPTDDELAGWWATLSSSERYDELRKLDRVEHETPSVGIPEYDVIVTGDAVILRARSPLTLSVGHLGWAVTLPEQRAAYDPGPDNRLRTIVVSVTFGTLAGILATLALTH